jgi:hypothetical protein
MWGNSSGTISIGTYTECPKCGYRLDNCVGFHNSGYVITYAPSRVFDRFDSILSDLEDCARRNPKWKIWHNPAVARRSFSEPLWRAQKIGRPMIRVSCAPSIGQRIRSKRRRQVQLMRRKLAL